MGDDEPILQLQGVSKRFGGVQALADVSFDVFPGEIHGLVGENGAGKSTLIKILGGVYARDAGQIRFAGRPHAPRDPAEAQRLGISVVHQEIPLCPNMSVADNVFLGRTPLTRWGRVDRRAMQRRTAELLAEIGQRIDPSRPVGTLSVAERQITSIVQALSHECKLLVMDEPTAALTPAEVETLFAVIRRLREKGTTILFVSHILSEVLAITDRVTVLRNGRHVATRPTAGLTAETVVRMMVGEVAAEGVASRRVPPQRDVVLRVKGLSQSATGLAGISFDLFRQEVLGIAGIQGAGRTELAMTLFGVLPATSGEIEIGGRPMRIRSPRDAIQAGIGYLTEDRRNLGLFWDLNVAENMITAITARLTGRLGRFDRVGMRRLAEGSVRQLGIRTPGVTQGVRYLSGGNQQKVMLARWLQANPSVLILDEPTRGIDVAAKAEIRRIIRELVHRGLSVILISSDLDELLALSDRVLVMARRRVRGTLTPDRATREAVMALATGGDLTGRESA